MNTELITITLDGSHSENYSSEDMHTLGMTFLTNVVVISLLCILVQQSECNDNFTEVFGTQLLFIGEQMSYQKAEEKCEENGSKLVEIWSDTEWTEVTFDDF